MTKKHFITLADALRRERPADHWDPNKMVQWDLDCRAIATACASINPNFNRARWLAYIAGECGSVKTSKLSSPYKCPSCGTNGAHYCPADIARE